MESATESASGRPQQQQQQQQQPQLPPGFRFHPTDEELVVHYLKKKAAAAPLPVPIIAEVDLYKFDPWELPAKAIFGEQEWYFFSPRDRKYPNGARPNRTATSGYWKATGTDKPVLTSGGTEKVGVKKALVFYGGKPPKGVKTNWIMHEYRLDDNNKPTSKPPGYCDFINKKASLRLDDWVLCRIYKKNKSQRPMDQDRKDIMNHMNNIGSNIPPIFSMPSGQNDTNLYEGGMNNSHSGSSGSTQVQFPITAQNLLPTKRALPNIVYNWNEEGSTSTRRSLLYENCADRTDETTNSITTILDQLPQTAQLGNIGDGVFGQQPTYVNWFM